jgi:uncharacterized protein (DUF1501 family)
VGTTTGGMLFLPEFLTALPSNLYQNHFLGNRQIVVRLQLNGGNDGLNTFIPYANPLYYEYRRNIGIPKNEVLKVANGMGFHPIMTGLHQIMQDGNLSVVQNVGYPNPNRSHFRSVEIWQTATNSHEYSTTGWLGRYLEKPQNLWKEVSESVKAFYDDMKAVGLLQNVTLMIFSEFGRRTKENGSGTDHGAAAPVFVIGGGNKGKIIGQTLI